MKSLYWGSFFLFLSIIFCHEIYGMDCLKHCFACSRKKQSNDHVQDEYECKQQLLNIPVHDHNDLKHLLYDVLDTMPLDLINIILGYDCHEFKGHCAATIEANNWIDCLFFVDDDLVIVGLRNGVIILFSLKTGRNLKVIRAHADEIIFMGFDNKKRLFSASIDGTIKFWNLRTGECVRTIDGNSFISNSEIPPHRLTKLSASLISSHSFKGLVQRMDYKTESLTCAFNTTACADAHDDAALFRMILLNPIFIKGRMIALELVHGEMAVRKPQDELLLRQVEARGSHAQLVDFVEPVTDEIALYDEDAQKNTGFIKLALFSRLIRLSKRFWVSDSTEDPSAIKIWDCKSGACIKLITMDNRIRAMLSLFNGLLAVGLNDCTVRLINPRTGKSVLTLNHGAFIKGLQQLKDGRLVSYGAEAKIWS